MSKNEANMSKNEANMLCNHDLFNDTHLFISMQMIVYNKKCYILYPFLDLKDKCDGEIYFNEIRLITEIPKVTWTSSIHTKFGKA